MPLDDIPADAIPATEAPATDAAPADDVEAMAADLDAATDARRWIRVGLEVLTADVGTGTELCDAEFRAARVEASRLIARLLRSVAPDSIE